MTPPPLPSFSGDFVADDVDSNLTVVQDFITKQLNEKLEQLKKLAEADDADISAIKASTKELAELVRAQQLAIESVNQLQQGRTMEARVLQTASNDTLPLSEIKNRADEFAKAAEQHFFGAKNNVEEAARLVSKQPGFFAGVSSFFKKSPSDSSNPVQTFWDRVSVATFGLAVLSTRVSKLPGVLMEQLEQQIDRRVVAVTEVVNHWKQRATSEYHTLKSELLQVVEGATVKAQGTKEAVGQNVQNAWDKTVSVHNAATQVLEENVDKVLSNFSGQAIQQFIDGARDKINSWSASVFEVAQQQRSSFKSHYQSSLEQRSAGRNPPPLPERVEPQMPKTP